MVKTKIAIVDDLQADRSWLAEKIDDYMNSQHLPYRLFSYESGEQFLLELEKEQFDIVFMDIYMNGITGVEAAGELRKRDMDCKLVFLTTTEEYMRQGFSLNSSHYLIKPVGDKDFVQAMENCRLRRLCEVPYLTVTSFGRTLKLDTLNILYVDISDRNAMIHMTDRTLSAGRNFNAISDALLADKRFLLCIKGIVINMDYISRQENDTFCLTDGSRIPIALRGKKNIISLYRNYIFDNMGGAL
ncbi:MAG: LytTR family DNA-binding domain-containing protein [Hespellia sp.]|nr:LytTR family DNA-binding domain-containing protein [Hespellia sp.]